MGRCDQLKLGYLTLREYYSPPKNISMYVKLIFLTFSVNDYSTESQKVQLKLNVVEWGETTRMGLS